ncbi:hypothetical protein OIU85_022712 [Salix viminalis]|uniref:Reverse transcriptase zinc-binding domain-containing protein n=1 Tax=Salix viminalis TaxID=40686 RepID=A0A9Q0U7F5_SALVM|nr:hypothetical protein OIU85_022712 [Salix viminalis]
MVHDVMWLASQGRLRTMDRAHGITLGNQTCKLCNRADETHEHLFFQCPFSTKVWLSVKTRANILWPNLRWSDLLSWVLHRVKKKDSINNYIGSLAFTSTAYHLWQERNRRIFQNNYQDNEIGRAKLRDAGASWMREQIAWPLSQLVLEDGQANWIIWMGQFLGS